ncbi:LOW QUALITY PROTEIN: hypothetical protein PAHAL_6G279400 [Panicum hallii]|uniref:KIB1-4 beta-propeller domain-containing protein n=1 Tax=Panicum hallii TaxID=206008 RepID=A0A2S3I471_9POAL|nr:LOW QUALITY PROTEIN: hypothetical protein PAHAL_6G279400 [Panicum hallii]
MDHDAASPPWAELPAEVLGEVARHLHDAACFLRFHAACRAWRAASSAPAPVALHPWLVAPCGLFSSGMRFLWPFSPGEGKGGAYLPHPPALRGRRFDSADAASGRVLAAGVFGDDRTASLVKPLTGDAAPLPPLPCVVAPGPANGAVLCDTTVGRLVAAVLQPGEADWEEIHVASPVGLGLRDVLRLDEHDRRAAALCSVGVLAGGNRAVAKLPPKPEGDRYVLEYRGELLCVDFLNVHALEAGGDGAAPPQWVERERGRGTERACLFLGWESSFAVDAREFAGAELAGGCAYFGSEVDDDGERGGPRRVQVQAYSFKDGTVTVVDELPAMFDRKSMWYTPRPRISPVPSSREPAINPTDQAS